MRRNVKFCNSYSVQGFYYLQALETEMNSHEPQLMSVVSVGQDLIDEQQFGAEKVQGRLEEIMNLWQNLKDLSDYRKRRLTEAVDYHQVNSNQLGSSLLFRKYNM